MESLRLSGHIHGPFSREPLAALRCSPVGVVARKRNPAKLRLINHLSWPDGLSVNDGIPDDEAHISYDMFERAVQDLLETGPGSLLAKLDLKDAFRHIPVRSADWHHLGMFWNSKFYYAVVLMFGLKSAPYIFNLFAEALHWIIQHHIPSHLRHYLDDFLLNFGPSCPIEHACHAVEWVLALGRELGLNFQLSKTVWPSTSLEFLGIILDSELMEARLPPDKLVFLYELLDEWHGKRGCTQKEANELVGYLQFCSQVIPHSRSFLRRLIDFQHSPKFTSRFTRLHIPSGVVSDLNWWFTFSRNWNGIRFLAPTRPAFSITTDASGVKGLGGIFGSQWFSSRCPRRYRSRDIHFKELYAILQAILRWGDGWNGYHITFYCDNQNVVQWLTTGTSRSKQAMPLLRLVIMLAVSLNFSFSCVWLSSEENALADAASRFQYSRLFQLAPYLEPKPCGPKSQILGMKHMLNSVATWCSSSGTGSLPALGKPTHLARNHTSISSSSTPSSSFIQDNIFLQRPLEFSLGRHHSGSGVSSAKPLNPMSPVFVPSTSMLASISMNVNLSRCNAFSAASSGSKENAHELPNCPSPLTSFKSFPPVPVTSLSSPMPTSMQHPRQHGPDFCDAASSLSQTIWLTSLTPPSTSHGDASNSSLPSRIPHMSN